MRGLLSRSSGCCCRRGYRSPKITGRRWRRGVLPALKVCGGAISRIQRIQALAKASVARGALHAVECFEIRPRRPFPTIVIELQQRGILQPEEDQPRYRMNGRRDRVAERIGNLPDHLLRLVHQARGARLFGD